MKPGRKTPQGRQFKDKGKNKHGSVAKTPVINFEKPSFKEGLIVSVVLISVTLCLYFRTIDYGYLLDDGLVISENMYTTQGVKGIPDIMKRETFEGYFKNKTILVEGGRYRPLSLVTFAVEWSLFAKEQKDANGQTLTDRSGAILYEGNPHISHFINILLYALTGILIFLLLYAMFRPVQGRDWFRTIPFLGALLFMLHPVHIEAVANIKGRDEIMAMLGALSALYFSLRYVYTEDPLKKALYLFLSGIFFLLGLLSKENAVTFLAVIPLTIWFFTPAKISANIRATVPALIGTIIYAMMRIDAVGISGAGKEITDLFNNPFYGMSFPDRYATIFYTLLIYLKLLFFPHPLTTDYWPYHVPWMHWSDIIPILSLAVYLFLGAIAIKGFKKKSVVSYCILFFMITLSVASNLLFSIGSFMNERFIFMSSLAFCILAAWFIADRMPVYTSRFKVGADTVGITLAVLISAGFIIKTSQRIPDWKDGLSINFSAVRVSKNSARANFYAGNAIYKYRYKPQYATLVNMKKDSASRITHADTARLKAILDSVYSYVTKAIKIVPQYNVAMDFKAGIAGEYYKLGLMDEGQLLVAFDSLVRSGGNVPFILEFTKYLSRKALFEAQFGNKGKGSQDLELLRRFNLDTYRYYSDVKGDRPLGLEYLKLASDVAPGDTAIASIMRKETSR